MRKLSFCHGFRGNVLMIRTYITVDGEKVYGEFPAEYERVCDLEACEGIIEPGERVQICGRMYLPGNVSVPLDLDFHDSCLPEELAGHTSTRGPCGEGRHTVITMSEPAERVIMVALPVEARIRELDPEQAAAVNRTIDSIGPVRGTPIDLPTGDAWNPYYALPAGGADAPVVIYRKTRRGEDGDYLVVSLMSPEQYRQQKADERSGMLKDPVVREEIRVAAGTAATIAVRAIPGFPCQGGNGRDHPRGLRAVSTGSR